MPHWEFPGTEPIDLDVRLTSGKIVITAEPTEMITVDIQSSPSSWFGDDYPDELLVEYADGCLRITEPPVHGWLRQGSLDIAIKVPAGSRGSVNSTAADLVCTGELGSLDLRTVSGDIKAETATGDLQITTTSGRVRVEHAARSVTAKSASGAIELGRVGGDVNITTVSGRVQIAVAEAAATIRTATGRVRVDSLARGLAEIGTVSGDIGVDIAPGIGVYLDLSSLSGRVSSELEPSGADEQADLQLRCRSISGSLRVGRAVLADVKG